MSKTESFESVMDTLLNGFTHDVRIDELSGSYKMIAARLDRLKAAHDREIRDTAQQQYHRGYEGGRHSMDAEHRVVAMRLRALPMNRVEYDANLYDIIEAVCGTNKACDADFRDELVRLMGGVSDELSEPLKTINLNGELNHLFNKNCDSLKTGDGDDTCACADGGACAAAGCDCAGEQKEVGDGRTGDSYTRSRPLRSVRRDDVCMCRDSGEHSRGQEVEHGGTAHDCASDSRGRAGSKLVHMDGLVTYDVLDNERRRVIAELRKIPDVADSSYTYDEHLAMIYDALDVDAAPLSYSDLDEIRDNLIHLLGGDQPSGIDVLRAMDAESDANGTSPNDVRTSSITDELRERITGVCKVSGLSGERLYGIADRIDEQFDRICQQHEAVVQSIIAEVIKERKSDRLRIEKLESQRDRWRQEATDLMNRADDMEHECDERAERKELSKASVDAMSRRANEVHVEHKDDCLTLRDGLGGELKLVNGDILLNGKSLIDALMDSADQPDSQKSPNLEYSDGEGSITDELQKWASTEVPYKYGRQLHAIADRIDEQFDRICQQHEDVLQSTIDTTIDADKIAHECYVQRIEELEKQRDELSKKLEVIKEYGVEVADAAGGGYEVYNKAAHERDELRDERINIIKQYAERCIERADLLDLLRDARDEYKTLDRASSETSVNFHTMRDRVWGLEAERDELQAKLGEYEQTHMKLPRDKDGTYINVADTVRINDREYGVYAVSNGNVWLNPFDDDLYRLYGYPADECNVVKKGDAING